MLGLPNYEMILEIGGSNVWLHQPRHVWWACSWSVLAGELAFLHTLSEWAEIWYLLPHCLIPDTWVLAGRLMDMLSIWFLLSGGIVSTGLVGQADLDTGSVSCDKGKSGLPLSIVWRCLPTQLNFYTSKREHFWASGRWREGDGVPGISWHVIGWLETGVIDRN